MSLKKFESQQNAEEKLWNYVRDLSNTNQVKQRQEATVLK